MRNFLFLNSFLLCATVSAFELTLETINLHLPMYKYSDDKEYLINQSCQEMQFNFLDEWRRLDELQIEIKNLTSDGERQFNVEKIHAAVNAVRETSVRLRHLAKPEWNSEIMTMWIYWRLPRAQIFDESDYINIILRAKNEGVKSLEPGEFLILKNGRPNKIKEVHIKKLMYMGEENVRMRDSLEIYTNADFAGNRHTFGGSFEFVLVKKATLLEICQFRRTLDVDIEVSYSDEMSRALNFEQTLKINLKSRK